MLRPQLLREFGWTISHILARDWFVDRRDVLDHLLQIIELPVEPPTTKSIENVEDENVWRELDRPEESAVDVDEIVDAESGKALTSNALVNEDVPTSLPSSQTPSDTLPTSFKRHFEFVGDSSRKFWEIALSGNTIVVRFGRIDTLGQTQRKIFADDNLAAHAARRLVAEKLGKGYQEKKAATG